MKTLLTLSAVLFLSACGGGNKSNSNSPAQNQESQSTGAVETGECSPDLLMELNHCEYSVNTFKDGGLGRSVYLIDAYRGYQSIMTNYSKISCTARDSGSGQVSTITKDYVAQLFNPVRSRLLQENENCKSPTYPKNGDEKNGCDEIQMFVKSL